MLAANDFVCNDFVLSFFSDFNFVFPPLFKMKIMF